MGVVDSLEQQQVRLPVFYFVGHVQNKIILDEKAMYFEKKKVLQNIMQYNDFFLQVLLKIEKGRFYWPLLQTVHYPISLLPLGSAIKNLGLFSKSPGDFKMETMDF